jgi:hypothetical protein
MRLLMVWKKREKRQSIEVERNINEGNEERNINEGKGIQVMVD